MTLRIRPDLDDLPAYAPGKTFPGAIKLASNEVTEGPLPSVVDAIADAASSLNRYPDNAIVELTATLAKKLGVTEDEVQVGCGSVILCQNLILVTCEPGDEVVFGWRSFETYPLATRAVHATPVPVPLNGDNVYDLDAMAATITDRIQRRGVQRVEGAQQAGEVAAAVAQQVLDDFGLQAQAAGGGLLLCRPLLP